MSGKIQDAMEVLKQAMIEDGPSEPGSYAHVWHCNISVTVADSMIEAAEKTEVPFCLDDIYATSNQAASRVMKLFFDVETKG